MIKTFKEWCKSNNLNFENLMSSQGVEYGGGNTQKGTVEPNRARDKVTGGTPASPAVGGPSTSTMAGGAKLMKKYLKNK